MASPLFSISSPTVIETEWTMEDVIDAHEVLDIDHDLKVLQANQE